MATLNVETHHIIQGAETEGEGEGAGVGSSLETGDPAQ